MKHRDMRHGRFTKFDSRHGDPSMQSHSLKATLDVLFVDLACIAEQVTSINTTRRHSPLLQQESIYIG